MKTFVIVGFLLLVLFCRPAFSQVKQVVVPYTLADRNRSIRMLAKLNALDSRFESINTRFESIDKQFAIQRKQLNDLKTIFISGVGIILSLFIFMLGFMIWDRHSIMHSILLQASRTEVIVST